MMDTEGGRFKYIIDYASGSCRHVLVVAPSGGGSYPTRTFVVRALIDAAVGLGSGGVSFKQRAPNEIRIANGSIVSVVTEAQGARATIAMQPNAAFLLCPVAPEYEREVRMRLLRWDGPLMVADEAGILWRQA